MTLVKIVETMHNTKNSFLKMLKIYLQLRNTLIKILNIKLIIVYGNQKCDKNGLGR